MINRKNRSCSIIIGIVLQFVECVLVIGRIRASGKYWIDIEDVPYPTINIMDVETRQTIGQPLAGHENIGTNLAFSPDGPRLASGSFDSVLILFVHVVVLIEVIIFCKVKHRISYKQFRR